MATRAKPTEVGVETKFRDVPTPEQLAADAEAKKKLLPKGHVIVKTANPGYMWDPELGQRIEDSPTVVRPSHWLSIQMAAGKIVEVEE